MGNSLPLPCVRQHDADEQAQGTGAKKKRRKQNRRPGCRRSVRAAARPRHVVPVSDTAPEDGGDGEEEVVNEAWRRPGCRVEPAGEDGDGVRRVKIVVRRKDIAELVARLEQRDAVESRNSRMEELNTCLGGNDGGRCGGATMTSPCRDAWRPRLSIIPENY
ncbi:unnamed protein product [Urochloa decumbens]|uniref:Uncharacterized protein n=1 Tax=Urochloa decumbens TaxID=240449 RepID=A0ABC9GJP3_9POAL